jgi:putative ABC transport system permease protein
MYRMKDFLLSIWRSATRERAYVAINLGGLALGFACCLVLALFVYGELSFDRHFRDDGRVYRLVDRFTVGGQTNDVLWTARAIAPLLAADHPQIEAFTRFTDASLQDGLRLRHDGLVLNWRQTYFADAAVFNVLPHQVLAGDPVTALAADNTVAISERLARAYFGEENPIGKLLTTDAGEDWKITLVFADLPPNTHLRYDALFAGRIPLLRDGASVTALREQLRTGFGGMIYLLMRPDFDPAGWERISADFEERYLRDIGRPDDARSLLWLQPLTQTHYQPGIRGDLPVSNPAYLYGCLTVALLILAVACINYTNLAAARALRRAHSVAIRKILGARRGRLLLECLGEAVLYALAAAAIALALAEIAVTLTPIGELLGQQVRFDLSAEPGLLAVVLGGATLVGLLAGAWPAVYLSSWLPVAAFSARGGGAASGARVRETLVLLQFVIAVGVVAATLVMAAQMRFVARSPLGFERENQVMVTIRGTDNFARVPALARELRQHPGVIAVAQAQQPPGRFGSSITAGTDQDGKPWSLQFSGTDVDAGFIPALGVEIVAGRNFSPELQGGRQFIINETMARQLDWDETVGRSIFDGRVVGVVRDFHFSSLRDPIGPVLLGLLSDDPAGTAEARRPFVQRMLIIRVSGQDFAGTLRHIEAVLRRFDPANPFEYTLLDETLGQLYATEQRMLALIATFAALCVLIACLGLFGLTAFATERRAREIAIRKVLGASSRQVVMLLARRILVLIGVGGVIAAGIAWFVMDEWLAGFAYRVSVSPALLVLSIALAAAVALATVTLQSLRTARADPAESLRAE